MARHDFFLGDRQKVTVELSEPTGNVVHLGGVIRLRQRDALGNWSATGIYTTASITLETWRPTALLSLSGFCALTAEPTGDAVLFRLSADEGLAFLYWDGAVWRAPVDDTEWNTELEIDAGIASFPVDCSITVAAKLVSGSGMTTPSLEGYYVFYEARYDCTEDILRSLHRKLSEEVVVNAEAVVEVVDPTDTIVLEDPLWTVTDPVEVYHQTNDPCFRTNLLASRSGNTLTLASLQNGPLLIRYAGKLDTIHVATDADFETETLPTVIIQNVTEPRFRDYRVPAYEEPLRSLEVVRLRSEPARHNYTFRLVCPAQFSLHDKKLADAVRRAFDEREWVRSLALDEDFPVVSLETVTQTDRPGDQIFTRIVEVSVSVLEWLPGYKDVPMVKTIVSGLRPFSVSLGARAE